MAPGTIVLANVDDGVAVVTLNEPGRRNPLSPEMVAGLTKVLSGLAEEDGCRVVVLTGAGRGFCAGADLARLAIATIGEDRAEYDAIIALNQLLWNYPKPTIAAVHGFALGGGCALMNWCDFALAEEGTRFGFPEVAAGLPATTVVPTLFRLVGRQATLELVLTGQDIDAAQAAGIGLVTRVVGRGEVMSAAVELAQTMACHDPGAIRMTKGIVAAVADMQYQPAVAYAKEVRVVARAMSRSSASRGNGGEA